MPFAPSLESYARYRERVGSATYLDLTRRTDPACTDHAWRALEEIVDTFGAPWVLQLWTKNPAGVLERGRRILAQIIQAGTTVTAQVTVTGLAGSIWEPRVPPDSTAGIPELAALIGGAEHICWRYDPIIPTLHQAAVFRGLADEICGYGVRRAVINFIAPPGRYKRVDRRLAALLPGWAEGMPGYEPAWRSRTALELVALAAPLGLRLACCAESDQLSEQVPGLAQAACGDAAWFSQLSGRQYSPIETRGSRPGCGCAPYYDLGSYGLWSHCHRCVYCYAG